MSQRGEARSANAELDDVVCEGADVLPIEVEAARGGALRSVFQYLGEKRRSKAIPLCIATRTAAPRRMLRNVSYSPRRSNSCDRLAPRFMTWKTKPRVPPVSRRVLLTT